MKIIAINVIILFATFSNQAQINSKLFKASMDGSNVVSRFDGDTTDPKKAYLRKVSNAAKNSVNIRSSKLSVLLVNNTRDIVRNSKMPIAPKIVFWSKMGKTNDSKPIGKTVYELEEIEAYPKTIKADKFLPFNNNGVALFLKHRKIGIVNDQGRVFLKPALYTHYEQYEGYIILKNSRLNPTKLYCFNTNMNYGYELPPVTKFNPQARHFGQVMKPRNGVLVTYPDKGLDILKYDLKTNRFIDKDSIDKLFHEISEAGHDVYKNEGILKLNIEKEVLVVGSILGNGIYPLFNADNTIYGYIHTKDYSNEDNIKALYYGLYYKGTIEIKGNPSVSWLNSSGRAVKSQANKEKNSYKGSSIITEVKEGTYKIQVF